MDNSPQQTIVSNGLSIYKGPCSDTRKKFCSTPVRQKVPQGWPLHFSGHDHILHTISAETLEPFRRFP
jgi:hypothetical protein